MKRTLVSLLGVALLALGGYIMAQSDDGSTDQPGASPPSTTSVGSPAQQDPSEAQPGSADDSLDQSGGGPARSQMQGSSTDQANGTGVRSHSSLPATASDLPLVYAIGVTAACAWLVLRAYRIRGAH